MTHPLDNPVWAALNSGNRHLAHGNASARYLPIDISPFAGIRHSDPEHFQRLYETVPFRETIAIFSPQTDLVPTPWNEIRRVEACQMLYRGVESQPPGEVDILPLEDRHVPQMLALTKLTNPGPFRARTIAFGHYEGILHGGNLVAMAGQRLHSENYVEISGVCTHPDQGGRGFARQLIQSQIRRILAQGNVPYLHVLGSNARAVKLYESMGFELRREMTIYFLAKRE